MAVSKVWKMFGRAATGCIPSVARNITTLIIIPTVTIRPQHVRGCETDIWTHMQIHRGHHHRLGLSALAQVAQLLMMADSSQANFALAPGGRPRLPMPLRLWKYTVNPNLPDLLNPSFIVSFAGFTPYSRSYDTGYTLSFIIKYGVHACIYFCYLMYFVSFSSKIASVYTLLSIFRIDAIFVTSSLRKDLGCLSTKGKYVM
jgi:hypothetical protein